MEVRQRRCGDVHPGARPRRDRSRPAPVCASRADVCERYGIVWVALETTAVAGCVSGPTVTTIDSGSSRRRSPTRREVLAAYQTDNLLDASHFPFLHRSLSTRNPLIGEQEIVDQHRLGFSTVQRKLADDDVSTEGWLRYTCVAPFTVLLRSEEPDGSLRQSFFQAIQPIDEHHTRMFFIMRVPETDPASTRRAACRGGDRPTGRSVDDRGASPRRHAVGRRARPPRAVRRKRDPLPKSDAQPVRRSATPAK